MEAAEEPGTVSDVLRKSRVWWSCRSCSEHVEGHVLAIFPLEISGHCAHSGEDTQSVYPRRETWPRLELAR